MRLALHLHSSTYFEADPPFAESDKQHHGYSRDHRPDCVQVVIALVVTPEGLPLAYARCCLATPRTRPPCATSWRGSSDRLPQNRQRLPRRRRCRCAAGRRRRLSPDIIRKRLDYWTLILGPKFSAKERKQLNLSRFYAIAQIEYCRNFIFKRNFPIHKLFERSCELGLWRLTADKIAEKPYPSASGGTKCCSREGRFVVEQITNITALGGRDDRLSPLLDRVPTALRR